MKIIELDLNKEDKKYFCKDINEVFEVKGGNLVTTTRDFSLAELLIDWNDETQKFFIYYSLINKKFKVDFVITMQDNNIYFSSREVAEKALEKFKDDLIKLYTWEFDF